ncbi:MAG: uracil-DNA glycosylase [Planctomycetaceae bacterium]|nr:uracil-DNA glycosylase [Planctomycetaceae bacterium]
MSNPSRALRQTLRDWQSAGLTHLPHAEPTAALVAETPARGDTRDDEAAAVPLPDKSLPDNQPSGIVDVPQSEPNRIESTVPRAKRVQQLEALAAVVSRCVRCQELAETRTQTVFGVGNPEARVMFIGEAPGADEDAQGEPFVGKAGQLLNKIITACGWKREDLYICNILRCRPPGNRNPSPVEAANCREYLDAQIRTVDPEYIVCWGSVAAGNLLDETTPIGRLRQKWFRYGRAKVLCTYHPSYLLRNPSAKKPVWDDMKFLLSEMGLEPPVP